MRMIVVGLGTAVSCDPSFCFRRSDADFLSISTAESTSLSRAPSRRLFTPAIVCSRGVRGIVNRNGACGRSRKLIMNCSIWATERQ